MSTHASVYAMVIRQDTPLAGFKTYQDGAPENMAIRIARAVLDAGPMAESMDIVINIRRGFGVDAEWSTDNPMDSNNDSQYEYSITMLGNYIKVDVFQSAYRPEDERAEHGYKSWKPIRTIVGLEELTSYVRHSIGAIAEHMEWIKSGSSTMFSGSHWDVEAFIASHNPLLEKLEEAAETWPVMWALNEMKTNA